MVSISNLINSGLLLVTQNAYPDLATPQQAATENYNIIKFLGGSAPYIQRDGYGIDVDLPANCSYQQVQLLSRHGERFPGSGEGATFERIYKKFQNYNKTFTGDLEFLNTYTYFVPDQSLYEKETTPSNSQGLYAGVTTAYRHGAYFRAKYNDLFAANTTTLPIFTSNSGRVYQTSNYFARGFLGDQFNQGVNVRFNILNESASLGANSLTPSIGCKTYNTGANASLIAEYNTTAYLQPIVNRLVGQNPGLNLTTSDVQSLFSWCAYEINVRGESPFCTLFTNEEFVRNSYHTDLSNYYSVGPGHNFTATIGAPFLNASLALLKNDSAENKIWLSFSHDSDLERFHAALGILEPTTPLPTSYIPFPNPYVHSSIVPQAARIYTEKYQCSNTSYVRYIVNDAVIPIPGCNAGPGLSCEFSEFEKYIEGRIGHLNFTDTCELTASQPNKVTFFWDWTTTNYSGSLGNF
ncbi:secreted acid phosphatase [Scheffersomyces amazonensis]|uniref:secreted acid phosphatase n=1 Tax=Scheffersomyces amazonensis TaxID=1078765 RepID=UPI00315CA070